jgi:hypothetical protein
MLIIQGAYKSQFKLKENIIVDIVDLKMILLTLKLIVFIHN